MISTWVSTGEDHYAHSLNYAHIAMSMLLTGSTTDVVPVLPMMRRAKLKTQPDEPDMVNDPLGLRIASR
jgi:hypothetical protein